MLHLEYRQFCPSCCYGQPGHVNDPRAGLFLWRTRRKKNVLAYHDARASISILAGDHSLVVGLGISRLFFPAITRAAPTFLESSAT